MNKPVALKIDVDTHDGMRDGVPRLLDSLEKFGLKATFCLSYGPDNAGKAIFRALSDPAFLKKMFKTGAPSLYGLRTILSGTLLPARPIATAFPETVKKLVDSDHEVIVHAWDHRKWQDRLHKMDRQEIEDEYHKAFSAHEKLTGERPKAVASPGWQATPLSLDVEDSLQITYASDMREGEPCFLQYKGHQYKTLQIPGTGPCVEELLTIGVREKSQMLQEMLTPLETAVQPVLTLHAEVEGGLYNDFFEMMIERLLLKHSGCITLIEAAKKALREPDTLPILNFKPLKLSGRAGLIASAA